MSLFVVDVDRLKVINDSLGHSAGDEVLRRVAAVLSSTFRQSDVVARHGGDEFVVLAVDAAQTKQRAIAARFEHGIELHNRRSGVVVGPADGARPEMLIGTRASRSWRGSQYLHARGRSPGVFPCARCR